MLVHIAQVWDEGRADELARYEQWCDCADTEVDRAVLRRMLDERNPARSPSASPPTTRAAAACLRRSARCITIGPNGWWRCLRHAAST